MMIYLDPLVVKSLFDGEGDVKIEEARPGRLEWPEPAAISIPFARLPINQYIKGPEYKVSFTIEFP